MRLFDGSSATYEFTSQIFFDEQVKQHRQGQSAYNRGRTRDTLNANDNVYGSDGAQLIASTTGAPAAGYAAAFDVGLSGLPASWVSKLRREEALGLGDEGGRSTSTASGQRRLTLTLAAGETVSAYIRLATRRHHPRAPPGGDAEGRARAGLDAAAREEGRGRGARSSR